MNCITKDEEYLKRRERIREIRENLKLTQEAMAEVLEISVDAYGKIENGVNGVSAKVLKNYRGKLGVSADYILFGDHNTREQTWDVIMNCTEKDKLYFLVQLLNYFTESKKAIYPLKNSGSIVEKVLEALEEM